MKSPSPQEAWTDDLPVCHLSGVGFSTNQRYREDGFRQEEHPFEDRSFHFKLGSDTFLYGVFDGHCTSHAADIAKQCIPAELALGQLKDTSSSEQVKKILHQAFAQVEKEFFVSVGDLLAERTTLQLELQQYGNQYEAVKNAPDKIQRLADIDGQICSGSSAVVVLAHNNEMYVANIGNSRALLCQTDSSGLLRVRKFTVDHTVENESELARLADLGLPIQQIRSTTKLGHHVYTRCLGDYSVKGGYKMFFENLSGASSEPVIAEPDVEGGIPLDTSSSAFLILMSDGVYMALEHATGTDRANADIASMVASEFSAQSTLHGVAQAVIDRVVRMHHDAYALAPLGDKRRQTCQRHDDMTLLVRNFGYPMQQQQRLQRGAGKATTIAISPDSAHYDDELTPPAALAAARSCFSFRRNSGTATTITDRWEVDSGGGKGSSAEDELTPENSSGEDANEDAEQNSSIEQGPQSLQSLHLDASGCVAPYVSFAEYYEVYDKWTEEAKKQFEDTCTPKMDCDTITEQIEPRSPDRT